MVRWGGREGSLVPGGMFLAHPQLCSFPDQESRRPSLRAPLSVEVPALRLVVEREREAEDGERLQRRHHLGQRRVVAHAHVGPRLIELVHRLLVGSHHSDPLVHHPRVEARADEGTELDVRVVGRPALAPSVEPVDSIDCFCHCALRHIFLLDLSRRVARLLHKVPDVVSPYELERLEAVQQHAGERRAQLPPHQHGDLLIRLVIAQLVGTHHAGVDLCHRSAATVRGRACRRASARA
mmetsp:Transcript_47068/g.100477  ORF Transcript_47068/g.100477 Transcript_47068/m.100477 type:complete len:238 (+) Transcript_47068:453-1166(+)